MSELRNKLLGLTELRYQMLSLLLDSMRPSDHVESSNSSGRPSCGVGDPVLWVLKCHLLSEAVLDRLLTYALEPNGEAVLAVRLSYSQKLEVASRCVLAEDWELLPDFVIGSLRKLNRIRNRLAHELGATVTREEVHELFMGIEYPMPIDPETADVSMLIFHYTPFIFGNMLPKYELVDETS